MMMLLLMRQTQKYTLTGGGLEWTRGQLKCHGLATYRAERTRRTNKTQTDKSKTSEIQLSGLSSVWACVCVLARGNCCYDPGDHRPDGKTDGTPQEAKHAPQDRQGTAGKRRTQQEKALYPMGVIAHSMVPGRKQCLSITCSQYQSDLSYPAKTAYGDVPGCT